MKKLWYVTATDKFVTHLSGLGGKPKIDKIVIVCDSLDEALRVEDILLDRKGYAYVKRSNTKPNYPASKYRVTVYKSRQWRSR